MAFIESAGHFFFRTRNALFPVLLIVVLVIFPPRASSGNGLSLALLCFGLAVLAAGQGLRMATIGLDYIQRGGKNGRIYAAKLVTGGLFGECRNPMYAGNVLMAAGFFLIAGNLAGIVIGAAAAVFVYTAIVRSEEQYLAREFGGAYAAYCRDVPRWLPSRKGLAAALAADRFDWASVVIREYNTLYTTVLIVLALLAWKARRAGELTDISGVLLAIAVAATLAYGLARYLKKSRRLRPLRR